MCPSTAVLPEVDAPFRQLILDLGRAPGYDSEDFLVSASNATAFAMLDSWPAWPAATVILTGPPGAGKSHLATIWARHAEARVIQRGDVIEPDELARCPAVVLEDCDRATRPEAALFHLLNLMKESGSWLVMTARDNPDQWGLGTADLLSRLRLSPIVTIGRPDAAMVRAVLIKLFSDRQIRIDEDVVAYAALHLDRSLEAATAFVQAIDDAALSAGRRITRPLAAATIANLAIDEP
jgi:chromosomal replication initiation ATPase DnaA